MQVACPECHDESVSPYAIGYQLDSPDISFGAPYTQLLTDMLTERKAGKYLEITGKYFSNEPGGEKLAQARAHDLSLRLKEDLGLKLPPLLRSQKIWHAAPLPDTFFQAIELQWIDIPISTLALERTFYPKGRGADLSLSTEDLAYLSELVDLLKKDARKVQVSGHTDDRGNRAENIKIGDRRALVVVDALKSLGLAEDRITWTNAMGKDPLVPNTSSANRLKNRRAFLKVMP